MVILALLLTSSCTQLSQELLTGPQLQKDAEQLFLNGHYEEAHREFQRMYEESPRTSGYRIQALYGLACSRIVLARTDQEFAEGISNLEEWEEKKGNMLFYENRRLLVIALKVQSDFLAERSLEQQKQGQKKDRLIASQKKKITQLSETVERLQKQLEELEAIDENFQEKRKTL